MSDENLNDPNNMVEQTSRTIDDLECAIKQDLKLSKIDFDNILVCGMGGSAIGGDIVVDCLYKISQIPIRVVRFPELPKWAGEKTLVIVSSYSGNTMETISTYDLAKSHNCKIIVVTSGGKLMEKCEKDNVPVVQIKGGLQPRNAVGYSIGYIFNIIASVGGPDIRNEVIKSTPGLRKHVDTYKSMGGKPKDYASQIKGTVPIIYSTTTLSAMASRWKSQFNENSKMIAFEGHIPDTNHGDIVGVMKDNSIRIQPILLMEDNINKIMKEIVNAITTTIKERDLVPIIIKIPGKSVFERTFHAMVLGDFISLHLAFSQNIDPSTVAPLTSLKDRLNKFFTRRRR